jgi:hypothetical protein
MIENKKPHELAQEKMIADNYRGRDYSFNLFGISSFINTLIPYTLVSTSSINFNYNLNY